jgi:hypothetical protein
MLTPLSKPLRLTEVYQSPEVPGIYVWYGCLILGEADNATTESLLGVLNGLSTRLQRQRMEVQANLNFGLTWTGFIEPVSGSDNARIVESGLALEARRLVSNLLLGAQHLFFQPLYIGMTEKSLRQRLKQHADEFLRLRTIQGENSSGNILQGEDDFAQRAAKLGFNEDNLCCYVLPVGSDLALDEAEVRKALYLVESYLNHWATPLLGRR